MDDERTPLDVGARGRRTSPGVWIVAAAVVMVVTAAVVIAVRATGAGSGPGSASASDDGLTTSQVVSVWDAALDSTSRPLIIVGYGTTTQVGTWESRTGDNNKRALLSGLATVGPDVTRAGKGSTRGTVRFTDGTLKEVGVLDVQTTARLLISEAGEPQTCDHCTAVVLTDPKRTTASVKTATGAAKVPAWSFGVAGSAVRFVQAAVDPADLLQAVPGLPYGLGQAETTVHVESDGRLTVKWTGTPSVAQAGGCGRDYRLEFVEGTRVVVLRFVELPFTGTDRPAACTAMASSRTATVRPPHLLGSGVLVQDGNGFVIPRV